MFKVLILLLAAAAVIDGKLRKIYLITPVSSIVLLKFFAARISFRKNIGYRAIHIPVSPIGRKYNGFI